MTATKVKRKSNRKQTSAPKKRVTPRDSAQVPEAKNEWFELRTSQIQGRGGFAIKDIPKGTRIVEYTGERISNAEADRRYDDESMGRHHTFLFTLNSRTCVDAAVGGNDAMYINHSCDPNCEAVIERGKIWIDAIKRIPAGTELVYDYQYEFDDEYTENDLRWYKCACGSPKCRGTIVAPKSGRKK